MPKKSRLFVIPAVFLCATFPAWSQNTLPEGNGKKMVESACVACHELSQVTNAGYSHEGWRNNVNMMVNVGAPLSKEQADVVIEYLAKNFPEKPKPPKRVRAVVSSNCGRCCHKVSSAVLSASNSSS